MALTRKFLSAMGIDEEKVDEIIAAHTDTINALKEDRDKYKADADKLPAVMAELEKLKTADTESPYKVKYDAKAEEYDALKVEFEQYKADVAQKALDEKKKAAYRQLLKDVGIADKRIEAVLRVSDVKGVELEDGKIKDADKLTESIKTEWSDFIVTDTVQGASVATPPANTGGSNFEKMSLAEKMTYANEHAGDADVQAWLKKKGK